MDRLNRSFINMVASLIGYIIPMIIQLMAIPILLKLLGETAFGLQSLVAVIIGYMAVMEMGLAWPITKYLAEDHARNDTNAENHMLSTTLQLYGAIGLVGMVGIILSAKLLSQSVFKVPDNMMTSAIQVFRLAGIGFLGSVLLSWGQAVGLGLQRFEVTYGVIVVANLVGVSLGLGIVYAGYGVTGYVLTRVVVAFLSGVAYLLLVSRLLPTFRVRWGFDRITLRRIRGYVGYGAINRVLGGIVGQLDKTLIGVWFGIAGVGVYAVPFLVASSFGNLIANLLGFIFPMASELQSLGKLDHLRDIFTRATRFVTALAGMFFVPLFVLGDIILALWVPSIAGQAAGVLRLLTLASYLGTLFVTLTNNVVIGMGFLRQFTIYTTIRGIVLGALCLLLIRPFGFEGAGWALLLTTIVDGVFFLIVLHMYLQIQPLILFKVAYFRPLVLSATLALLAFLARPYAVTWIGLTSVGAALGLFYLVVGYWFGIFGETEKKAILGLCQSLKKKNTRQTETIF